MPPSPMFLRARSRKVLMSVRNGSALESAFLADDFVLMASCSPELAAASTIARFGFSKEEARNLTQLQPAGPRCTVGITHERDLRDGDAVWASHALPKILGSRLGRSTRTDIVVVGAGISGAMIAQSLTEVGKRLLIVDRRRAALLGSTAASTALLQFELDTPLLKLSRSIGRRKAEKVWIASRDAVNELRTR